MRDREIATEKTIYLFVGCKNNTERERVRGVATTTTTTINT